jgi:hypothetical protein
LAPKIVHRNITYQKKGLVISHASRNPFVLNTERSKQIDEYANGIRGVGMINNSKLNNSGQSPIKARLDSSINIAQMGKLSQRNQLTLNQSPEQSLMYQNKYEKS